MEFVCNYDNGKGDPYVLTLDRKPLRWRCKDSCNVGIQDEYGVTHTVIFNSEYQAALYVYYIDYEYDIADIIPNKLAGEMRQFFRGDLWTPNAKNTGYGFMMLSLICRETFDYEEFKKQTEYIAKKHRENKAHEPYMVGLNYVIKAMVDVEHIKIEDGVISLTDKKGDS